jgi:predicted RNase H-like HicB family nuclease
VTNYLALLRKDADSDFSVDFPDFPGCITAGATLEEARVMAAEALALHIQGMIEDREPVPAPSPLDTIVADAHNRGAIPFLVTVPDQAGKPVRFNASFPEDLLIEVDRAASRRGLTRSGFLARAAKREIQIA